MALTVTPGMTTPKRAGKQPRPVWYVDGPDVDAYASALFAIGGRHWPRNSKRFSFFEDPTEAIAKFTDADRESFAERQAGVRERADRRAERLSDSARRHAGVAEGASRQVHRMLDVMQGEPIHVGHHSEGRHRRDIARVDTLMRRSIGESEYAGHLASRARHAEHVASGEHTRAFIQNRIDEVEALLRDVQRKIERYEPEPGQRAYVEHLATMKAEYEDRLGYWRGEMEASGGVSYSRETVKPGDLVLIRGRWEPVVRANAKTVSVPFWIGEKQASWTLKYSYAEIREHRPQTAQTAQTAQTVVVETEARQSNGHVGVQATQERML
jgi:hypothetical protein